MARSIGGAYISGNFELVTKSPLDARTVVPDQDDLETITNAYEGLIVYVENKDECYVCIDPANIDNSIDTNTDDIDPSEWKNIGADSTKNSRSPRDFSCCAHDTSSQKKAVFLRT